MPASNSTLTHALLRRLTDTWTATRGTLPVCLFPGERSVYLETDTPDATEWSAAGKRNVIAHGRSVVLSPAQLLSLPTMVITDWIPGYDHQVAMSMARKVVGPTHRDTPLNVVVLQLGALIYTATRYEDAKRDIASHLVHCAKQDITAVRNAYFRRRGATLTSLLPGELFIAKVDPSFRSEVCRSREWSVVSTTDLSECHLLDPAKFVTRSSMPAAIKFAKRRGFYTRTDARAVNGMLRWTDTDRAGLEEFYTIRHELGLILYELEHPLTGLSASAPEYVCKTDEVMNPWHFGAIDQRLSRELSRHVLLNACRVQ